MTRYSDDWWVLLEAERDGTLLDVPFTPAYIDVDLLEVVSPLNLLPLIVAWYERGDLRPQDANRLLARWWSSGGFAHDGTEWRISRATLIDLFDFAGGFVTDDPGVSRPQCPLTIWRGGVPGVSHGLSWSTHFGDAEDFAMQAARRAGTGILWTATIAPLYILGIFDELQQDEVVIDPSGLGEVFTFARYARKQGTGIVRVTYNEQYADSLGG